jgi:toluene monooxygenase system ferredoxin subunit
VPDDAFVAVAAEDELWDGEMEAYDVGDAEVLVVKLDGGFTAFDGICPHQSVSLVEGTLDGTTLTCRAHEWSFDVRSGAGVNPRTACLRRHAVRVRDGQVLVSRAPLPATEPAL